MLLPPISTPESALVLTLSFIHRSRCDGIGPMKRRDGVPSVPHRITFSPQYALCSKDASVVRNWSMISLGGVDEGMYTHWLIVDPVGIAMSFAVKYCCSMPAA